MNIVIVPTTTINNSDSVCPNSEKLLKNNHHSIVFQGIHRWMIELDMIHISAEVSTLSLHVALMCQEHLGAG